MSLTLGREGGIAKPLKKRTVGQINIAHVYDGANHIWPTSVIHFSDFTSVQPVSYTHLTLPTIYSV